MKFMRYALLIFTLFVLTEPVYADFIIPAEVDKIDQLSSEAFSKLKFFKKSQTICGNDNCGTIYAEINRPEEKVYFKITQGSDTIDGYVIDGITYVKGFGPSIHINTWRKAKAVPIVISDMLDPKQRSLEHCLRMCPTYSPDKIFLEEGLIDGKECYVVNVVYPEETKDRPFKTISKVFYQKNTYLPYGEHMTIENAQFKSSVEIRYYDYDIPLEIKLPQEAIGAKEVSPDEIKSLR